jgi:hypothetical protein
VDEDPRVREVLKSGEGICLTHYWNYAITGWDYPMGETDLLIQREQRLTVRLLS